MPHTSLAVFKGVVLAQIAIYMSIYYTFIGDSADIQGISVVISIYHHCVRANAAYLFLSIVYKFTVTMQHTTWRLFKWVVFAQISISIYIYPHFILFGGDFSGISMVILVYRRYNMAIAADRYVYLRLRCNILPGH